MGGVKVFKGFRGAKWVGHCGARVWLTLRSFRRHFGLECWMIYTYLELLRYCLCSHRKALNQVNMHHVLL